VIRAVLDTNLVVSAVLSRGGVPAAVVRAAGHRFDLVWSPSIAVECSRVLSLPRILKRLEGREGDGRAVLANLVAVAHMVTTELPTELGVVRDDPDDDVLFGTALAGGARFIVSGDAAVLAVGNFAGVMVVSAAEFLATLGES